jgi:hypothetical protein
MRAQRRFKRKVTEIFYFEKREMGASMQMAVLGRSGGCRGLPMCVGMKRTPYPQHFRTEITHQTIKFLGYHYRLGLNPVKSKTLLSAINKTKYGPNHHLSIIDHFELF